ncbi:MAG: glycosyltransferase [Chitinophagaceae bacterium]|nr:glycosyltransferase [Chitinophagaceae bacterium]MCW5905490.1 glycosyltransferase [Chitinophagaceae bacterium]
MKIIIIGSAHPLRGGLSTFNERLARQFAQQDFDTTIVTFSLQYPNFLFPGTTQYSSEPAPTDIDIKVWINSINPFNWLKVGWQLKKENADIIVVRYWLPFMGACLGTILRIAKKNKKTKIICIADNVIPHEKRIGDTLLTKYFVKPVHSFITMSKKVLDDLQLFTQKPAVQIVHPLYDSFGEPVSKEVARKYLNIDPSEKIILFFGFIRAYKGLDILLDAMKILSENTTTSNIKLLIAGEFYEDRKKYEKQIEHLDIATQLILKTDFIADSEVHYYLCAADFVIQPYRNATQSGVTPLAYHFNKPMLVTNVGGLPNLVPDKKVGLIAEPNPTSIAEKIVELYQLGEAFFLPHLLEEKKKYSWQKLTETIIALSKNEQ